MSAQGDRQHTPTEGRGKPPVAVPPIRDEKTLFVEETPEQGLDAFDSEASLGMLDRRARVERTNDLDLFPSEHVDADDVVVGAAPEMVVAPQAVVTADLRSLVVSPEQRAVALASERPAVVTAIALREPVLTTRRLALVAGIVGCLGLPTLGILLWRSPAPVVVPATVVREETLPSAATEVPREPSPTLVTTPPPDAPATLEPSTTSEPLMSPEMIADSRGPIVTPDPVADARPPRMEPTGRPERLSQGINAAATEATVLPLSDERAAAPINRPTEQEVPPSVTEKPAPVSLTPSMTAPAAPLPPAPPMLPPAAPASVPAVAEAGGTTAAKPAPARDASDIQMVLMRYRSAFSDLDAAAVSQVWPTVDARALARAFRGLEEQGIAFDNCDIRVTGATAAASCGGTVSYVTKVGSKDPRTEHRRWQFTLGKVQDLWMIQTVESR